MITPAKSFSRISSHSEVLGLKAWACFKGWAIVHHIAMNVGEWQAKRHTSIYVSAVHFSWCNLSCSYSENLKLHLIQKSRCFSCTNQDFFLACTVDFSPFGNSRWDYFSLLNIFSLGISQVFTLACWSILEYSGILHSPPSSGTYIYLINVLPVTWVYSVMLSKMLAVNRAQWYIPRGPQDDRGHWPALLSLITGSASYTLIQI